MTTIRRQPKGSKTVMVSMRLPVWIVEWLKENARGYSQAKLIVDALKAHYGLKERK